MRHYLSILRTNILYGLVFENDYTAIRCLSESYPFNWFLSTKIQGCRKAVVWILPPAPLCGDLLARPLSRIFSQLQGQEGIEVVYLKHSMDKLPTNLMSLGRSFRESDIHSEMIFIKQKVPFQAVTSFRDMHPAPLRCPSPLQGLPE